MILEAIKKEIEVALLDPAMSVTVNINWQDNPEFGDVSSGVALPLSKQLGKKPREVAEELKNKLLLSKKLREFVERIEIAGAGFLNFYLRREVFSDAIRTILSEPGQFGKNNSLSDKKIIIEFTDLNPFKQVHIGHMMTNAIGESLARVFEFAGAEVKRANYQGDIGLHVAKAVWHFLKMGKNDLESLASGEDYAQGSIAYDEDPHAKEEIDAVNKKIYEQSDEKINKAYSAGRAKSLEVFEKVYGIFGTKFDFYFFESEVSEKGKEAVEEGLKKGIFEKSDGAIVFRGEKYGLHTRVFINSLGLPTYEAKELGLSKVKYKKFPYDLSYIVTADEIVEYFKVLLKAMEFLYPNLSKKTRHIPHGVLRLPEGKMSSRTGKIISFQSLLDDVMKIILEKMGDVADQQNTAEKISMAAMKYSILKQSIGKDVTFDFKTSLSFEGDSGPYLQYTYARCRSVLRKAVPREHSDTETGGLEKVGKVARLLLQFPDAVKRAGKEIDPHYIATYLSQLAQAFNNFYGREKIIGSPDETFKLALTEAVSITLKNGLWLLGITAPEKM